MVKVITYGTFDLFHEGHYRLLQRAKALGDYLIVGVTTEEYDQTRGKLNVSDPLLTRIENVKKSGFADEIIIETSFGQKVRDIQKYQIDIFTVGSDWTGQFDYLKDYCQVVYLERTKNISSTLLREQKQHILRIGIVGTGRIANRFVPEAKLVSGVSIQSVYNPHSESAEAFARRWEINSSFDWETFMGEVDAVYVASPHETHYGYIKRALESGKHVLSEKPMVLEEAQAEELFALAKKEGLVLLEGIKTAYCPGFNQLLGIVCSGAIGKICNAEACFTKLESVHTRERSDHLYGGSFTELGSYVMLPLVKLFRDRSLQVSFDSITDENGLDIFTKAYFRCPSGMGTAACGLGIKSDGRLTISGTEGYVVAEAPWWKTTYFEVHRGNNDAVEKYSERFLGDGLRYEISDFLALIHGNGRIDCKLTPGESIMMARILERFLKERERARTEGSVSF